MEIDYLVETGYGENNVKMQQKPAVNMSTG